MYREKRKKKRLFQLFQRALEEEAAQNYNNVQKEADSSVQSVTAIHASPVTMCRSSMITRRGFDSMRILQVWFELDQYIHQARTHKFPTGTNKKLDAVINSDKLPK